MFSGVAGIRAHQTKMDVIGNNISNVNTQGFKASRAAFADMFNQTIRGASSPTEALGGMNPMQIGLGVSAAAVDVIHTTGATMTTGRMLDLAIQGEGFFTVATGDLAANGEPFQTYYTRAGNFYLDANGFMITASGMYLQGVMLIDPFDADDPSTIDENNPQLVYPIQFDNGDGLIDALGASPENPSGVFHPNFGSGSGFPIQIPPYFSSISIGANGIISGIHPDGTLYDIAEIFLTMFTNPAGLKVVGDNIYEVTGNSGEPWLYMPGQGGVAGDLRAGALEMSNVDLSREFTEMIVTQRGYQANSRIITVSDTLLEELINLKR
jgi:flagellar hook protein FlgE